MIFNKNIKKVNKYKIRKNKYKIYLDSMENNNFNNENFKKKLLKYILKKKIYFNRYYFKSDINNVKKKLKKFLNLNKQIKIIIGNGLDEIIFLICLMSNRNVGSIEPTFYMYEKYSLLLKRNFFKINLIFKNSIHLDYKKLNIFLKKKNIDLFFLCYPNNPTGNIYNKKNLIKIFKNNKNCIFVIDETYFDYCKKSFIKDIKKIKNIIILRTFSKIGFASLRIGYAICNKKIYKIINKIKLPYNLSILSLIAIKCIIKNINKKQIEKIIKQRINFENFLKKKNFFYYKSYCNFLLLKIKKKLFSKIKSKKILIKKIPNIPYKISKKQLYARISIGNKNEYKKLKKIMNERL